MSTLEIIVNAIVGLLGASGLITSLLFYRQTKRQKNVDIDGQVAQQWREYAINMSDRYEEIRKEKRDLWMKYNQVENELVKYRILQCKNINCTSRKPPLGTEEKLNDNDIKQ